MEAAWALLKSTLDLGLHAGACPMGAGLFVTGILLLAFLLSKTKWKQPLGFTLRLSKKSTWENVHLRESVHMS